MRKILIFFLVSAGIICTFFGCAKANNPASITSVLEVDQIFPTTGYARDIFFSENILYAAQDEIGFILFDRFTGNILGENNTYGTKYIVASEPDSFIVSYGDDYFYVFDFTVLDSINQITDSSIKDDFSRHPELDYVAVSKDTFRLNFVKSNKLKRQTYAIDSGVWQAIFEENLEFPYSSLKNFYIDDNYIYFAAGQIGFFIGNDNSEIIGEVDTSGEALDVKIVDNYAFVADRHEGFSIIDISDVQNPVIVSTGDTSGYAQSIDVYDDYLVVGSGGGGVYLFDISNKENPLFLDRIDDADIGYTYKVVFDNGDIFAATRSGVYKLKIN